MRSQVHIMHSQVRIVHSQVHIMQSQVQQLDGLLPHDCSFVLLGLIRFSSLVSAPYWSLGGLLGMCFDIIAILFSTFA